MSTTHTGYTIGFTKFYNKLYRLFQEFVIEEVDILLTLA